MVVDWLKECYQSDWHLFRDSLATTTRGYYYFAAPGTPHYPGFHHLGSRRWLDHNRTLVQSLGEDLKTKQVHETGVFAGQVPAPRVVGSQQCIQDGELLADAVDPVDLFHGYPLECFIPVPAPQPPPPPQPRDFERASAWDRCAVQRLWAKIIDFSYADAEDEIVKTIRNFCQGPVDVRWISPRGEHVGITLAIGTDWACVCLDGTRNFQQLAMQALYSKNGPTNIGIFGTSPFWYNEATTVMSAMRAAGILDRRAIFLSGHSYGGAVALLIAARLRFVDRNRTIRYLTYGCPKPGDDRLKDLLELCSGASLRNDNDLVTTIPPDLASITPTVIVFPQVLSFLYQDWTRPPTALTQDDDGKLIPGGDFEISTLVLIDIIRRAILMQEFSRVIGHGISEYIRRIELRCPNVEWPINEEVQDDLETIVGFGEVIAFPESPVLLASEGLLGLVAADVAGGELALVDHNVATDNVLGLADRGASQLVFDTPGAFSWTVPASVTSVTVVLIAAGGTGGIGDMTGLSGAGGGGAGGGAFIQATFPVTPGNTYSGQCGGAGGSDLLKESFFSADGGSNAIAGGGQDGFPGNAGGPGTGGGGGTTFTGGAVSNVSAYQGGFGGAGSAFGAGGGGGGGGGRGAAGGNGGTFPVLSGGAGGPGSGDGGLGQGFGDPLPFPGFFPAGGGGGGFGLGGSAGAGKNGVVYFTWQNP